MTVLKRVPFETGRRWETVADVLRFRAEQQPERVGYRFLADGESLEVELTYGDLDRRARTIATSLRQSTTDGERILLVYPPGLDFICAWFGCMYAGVLAVAVAPPRPGRAEQFLSSTAAIANDARPSVALTTNAILQGPSSPESHSAAFRSLRWFATDVRVEGPGPEWWEPVAGPENIAFLQYTSGSIAAPKGVAVTHGNLIHNLRAIAHAFWRPGDEASIAWLPPYHDMGLIGGILGPLWVGAPVTLMAPFSFVQRPRRWLQAITRYRGAVSGGPNFAYDLCVRRITPQQRAGLDLSCWRVAFNGAEPIAPDTIRRFVEEFAPCGFDPAAFTACYGLAESTLLVSVDGMARAARTVEVSQSELERHRVRLGQPGDDGTRAVVSCGRPVAPTVIVDPETRRPCPPGEVGEIWVSGPSVARGYWKQEAVSRETFRARLAGDAAGCFLRTGDLGFILDGELFVTGRLKDLIIIDGANHYPQDIERTVGESHPALNPTDCAAFSVPLGGREALVVAAAVQRAARDEVDVVKRSIRAAVAGAHDLRVHDIVLVTRGRIPRTTSGKVRRRACGVAYLTGTLNGSGSA